MKGPCPICGYAHPKNLPTPYGQFQKVYCPECRCNMRFSPAGELTYVRSAQDRRNYFVPALLLTAGGVVIGLLHESLGFLGWFFSACMLALGILAFIKYLTNRNQQKLILKRLADLGFEQGKASGGAVIEAQRQVESSGRRKKDAQEDSDDDFF